MRRSLLDALERAHEDGLGSRADPVPDVPERPLGFGERFADAGELLALVHYGLRLLVAAGIIGFLVGVWHEPRHGEIEFGSSSEGCHATNESRVYTRSTVSVDAVAKVGSERVPGAEVVIAVADLAGRPVELDTAIEWRGGCVVATLPLHRLAPRTYRVSILIDGRRAADGIVTRTSAP